MYQYNQLTVLLEINGCTSSLRMTKSIKEKPLSSIRSKIRPWSWIFSDKINAGGNFEQAEIRSALLLIQEKINDGPVI